MFESSLRTQQLAAVMAVYLTTPPGAAWAATPAAQAGLKLAQQYCTECHVVVPSASPGWTDAPSFQTIANRPDWTVPVLSGFIQKPHMHMLNTGRPQAEASEIAAYIVSLRNTQGPGTK